MAVYHGNNGVVKISSDTMAEVQEWSYKEADANPVRRGAMGDTSETTVASGMKRGSGSVVCRLDEDDTAQVAVGAGDTVSLSLYGEGTDTGDFGYTGSVVVIEVDRSVKYTDDPAFSFTFENVLTRAAVA